MKLPNVVIVGAPKSATTSVFQWLCDHPEVCGSTVKETFYLMDKGNYFLRPHSNFHEHGLEGYEKYFNHCKKTHKVLLEATPRYMYQSTALEVLSNLEPQPHIIFFLRKPSQRIYSAYQYYKNNHTIFKKDLSFRMFLELVQNGSSEDWVEFCEKEKVDFLEKEVKYSQYINYLSQWGEKINKEKIHIFLFEDLQKDPLSIMYDIAKKIKIEPMFYKHYNFKAENKTIPIKNKHIQKQIRKISKFIPKGGLRETVKKTYYLLQSKNEPMEIGSEDRKTLEELNNYFESCNEQLEKDFKIDLTSWK